MDQERTTGHAAAGRWELYHEARRTMIGSVWGSGSQSFRTILASSWGLVSFRGSRQTKTNHDWISFWIMFSIIWDNVGVNVEPFFVPKIARGPPCRPQRRPRYRPARPRRTMIGSVFGSCFRSSGTILASLWNHVWCPKSHEEPFLVPKIARGPPCRPLRCPRRHPMGPGTSQEHPY